MTKGEQYARLGFTLLLALWGFKFVNDPEPMSSILHAIVLPIDFFPILRQPGVPPDWIISVVDQNGRHFIRSHGNDKFAGQPLVPWLRRHAC